MSSYPKFDIWKKPNAQNSKDKLIHKFSMMNFRNVSNMMDGARNKNLNNAKDELGEEMMNRASNMQTKCTQSINSLLEFIKETWGFFTGITGTA